jgi:sucrose-6-phosphate hydrolase SacC (GH32 family)
MMKLSILNFIILFIGLHSWAQIRSNDSILNRRKQEETDPYRLDFKDVYENMHYNQPLRPQVHYTPITGQIADPTGLLKYKGTYHLFYMFDEWSKKRRDNKNWGHAISNDLIYWEQLPPITNSVIDNRPGSGSGIVDWNNSLQLRKGSEKTLAVFYTDYGRGVALAFSNDAGKTWIRHARNPVIPGKEGFRDPNVFWYTPDQSWRMVIYDEPGISFYKSSNLLDWQFLSKMEGFFECPDILHMNVDGKEEHKKWVLIDGNGAYYIGEFNGTKFIVEGDKKFLGEKTFYNKVGSQNNYYTKDIYATQSWKQTYEGDGPFYQLAFMMIKEAPTHNRTWSQQMIFPVELTLQTINKKIRLCRNPIDGIKQLRYDKREWSNVIVNPNENLLGNIAGDIFEIICELEVDNATEIQFDIRGEKLVYNTVEKQLYFMGTKSEPFTTGNKIKLRFIIDRNSIEIYGNKGEINFTRLFYPKASNKKLSLTSSSGRFFIKSMALYRLEPIWLNKEKELGYERNNDID